MNRSYRHQTLLDLLDEGGFAFDVACVQEVNPATYKVVWTRQEPDTFAAWGANNLGYYDFEVDFTRPLYETFTIIKETT